MLTSAISPTRRSKDDGVALVVALVITLVVFLLTTAMLADAFHNIVGSANGRERLTAINAAEAGVSWYSRSLESVGLSGLRSAPWTGAGQDWTTTEKRVQGLPGSGAFTLSARYWAAYDSATGALSAPANLSATGGYTDASIPDSLWVELTSVGKACRTPTNLACASGTQRSVRAVLEIHPLKGSLNGAFAGIYICELGNRFTITGPSADVYLLASTPGGSENCPRGGTGTDVLTVSSGQFTTSGSVYVLNGGVTLSNTSKIDGALWSKGTMTLGGGGGSGTVGAGKCSSRLASVLVCGNATSLASTPVVRTTGRVLGSAGLCSGCSLPALTFAEITETQALAGFPSPTWTDYSGDVLTYLSTPPTAAKPKYRKQLTCSSPIPLPSGTLYLANDLAIISPCGYTSAGRVEIRRSSFAPTGVTPTLYLVTGYTAAACTSSDARNSSFLQNFDATAIRLYVYTPCRITFRNQVNLTGQLLAQTLYAQGRTTINTVDLQVSGGLQLGYVQAFAARVLNIREI